MNKMRRCKNCGADIAPNCNKCPYCGAKQFQNVYIACVIIIVFTVATCISVALDSFLISPNNRSENPKQPQIIDNEIEDSKTPIFSDDIIAVNFIQIYEDPNISGAFYLQFLVENVSSYKIMVGTTDAYVNDIATTIMSGIPMILESNKNSKTPFFISYSNLDINILDELKTIKFKFMLFNDSDSSVIETTETITLDF